MGCPEDAPTGRGWDDPESLSQEETPSSNSDIDSLEPRQGEEHAASVAIDESSSSSSDKDVQDHDTDTTVDDENTVAEDCDTKPQTAELCSSSVTAKTAVLADPEPFGDASSTQKLVSPSDVQPPNNGDSDNVNSISQAAEPYEDSPSTLLLRKIDDDSPSRKQWLLRKKEARRDIGPLDELMLKYGLESVKVHFLWVYDEVQAARKRGDDPRKTVVVDTCFVGSSKSGKSMVGSLYAELLKSLDLVSKEEYECVTDLSKARDNLKGKGEDRAVLYIDDAIKLPDLSSGVASLSEHLDDEPAPALILEITGQIQNAEKNTPKPKDEVHPLYVIGLSAYTEEELSKILLNFVKKECGEKDIEGGWNGPLVEKYVHRAVKKAEKESLPSILKSVDTLKNRRSARIDLEKRNRAPKTPEHIFFTKADMLGHSPTEIGYRSDAWKELQEMVGMEKVKEAVRQLLSYLSLNDRLQLEGEQPIETFFNRRCFIGPPGTGKTMVAGLYGQILVDLDLVEGGDIITKKASDLIGKFVGHSEEATKDALDEAQDGVLIIDDFHLLLPFTMHDTQKTDVFRAAVIDTLVANIDPNSKRKEAIILIGYPESMTEAFEKANPGLARRFPLDQAFHFESYSDQVLAQILELKLQKHSLAVSSKGMQVAKEILSIASCRPNFGNGGEVENLLNLAMSRRNARCAALDAAEDLELDLLPQDFDPDFNRSGEADKRCIKLFEGWEGMQDILHQFQQYQAMAAGLRSSGHDPRQHIPWALVFRGPPGTGKTTVARKIGQIYYDMGFLSAAEVIECSVADLVSPHRGGSGRKVIRMFERALGKVLFIDEAYRLGEVDAVDAIGQMVDCMTKERFFGNLVVILAGYKEDMEALMQWNRGLRSRFATNVDFHTLKGRQSLSLLQKQLAAVDIELAGIDQDLGSGLWEHVVFLLSQLAETTSWAHGRDVLAFARTITEHVYTRDGLETELELGKKRVVNAEDVIPMLEKRMSKARREETELGIHGETKIESDRKRRRARDGNPIPAHVSVASGESSWRPRNRPLTDW